MNLKKINEIIAVKVTNFVGSMTCAYIFCGIALYGLTGVNFSKPFEIVQWVSQTFLQLVLLSVIMIGTNLLGANSEKRAEEDHEKILEEFQEIKEMHKEMRSLLTIMKNYAENADYVSETTD